MSHCAIYNHDLHAVQSIYRIARDRPLRTGLSEVAESEFGQFCHNSGSRPARLRERRHFTNMHGY